VRSPLNVLLLVIDSLRAGALAPGNARTPFLDRLRNRCTTFTRAYATECWTLPSHVSMFTGLLPSEHGAHFQRMAYTGQAPTVAELLGTAGFHTEAVSRNSIFDGSIPGLLRGFQQVTIPLSERGTGLNPVALLLALSKPRVRRQVHASGFFSALQRENREFLARFTRAMLLPADVLALDHVLATLRRCQRAGQRAFVFCNLYDVHAPYCPSTTSMFRPPWPPRGWVENAVAPLALAYLGGHVYLRPGFHVSAYTQRMLLGRYHRAIELMDAKLERFWTAAERDGLFDDTLVILCSDHGEGFGEHGLYLHDASVYETHLRVPLWVHHPDLPPHVVDDVVSLADLFSLMRTAETGHGVEQTLLSPSRRAARPLALAQHFHYTGVPDSLPRYRQDLMTAIGRDAKLVVRREGLERYDLVRDPDERAPLPGRLDEFGRSCRGEGADGWVGGVLSALHRWSARQAA
jgi:choline-sulfatase